jgi:hypothetical protein
MGCASSKNAKRGERIKLQKTKADATAPKRPPKGLFLDLPPPGEAASNDPTDVLFGVAKVVVKGAELKKKGHYNVTLSMGLQVRPDARSQVVQLCMAELRVCQQHVGCLQAVHRVENSGEGQR